MTRTPFDVEALARRAKAAAPAMAAASESVKNDALRSMAAALRRAAPAVLSANAVETAAARAAGKTPAFVDRLALDAARLEALALAVESVAELPDPVGARTPFTRRPNGLVIERQRVPLGVVAVIYESRPGVTADAAALCVKSGNCAILRGGKESVGTNAAIAAALAEGLRRAALPVGAVGFVDDPSRDCVDRLLRLDRLVDLVVPRGGPELTRAVREKSTIAVLSHDKGLVHVYVHEDAEAAMAEDICFNAKVERPGVCNAMETLLVHERVAAAFLPKLAARYAGAGVELRGCPRTLEVLPAAVPAAEADWDTEYLGLILSIKVVASYQEAVAHIARHGSGLAEAIVTSDAETGRRFQREVDAGVVYVNASTRFTDGGEFGLGAEMGISTQKLHARGPVGLEGLTCEKFVVTGSGQVRDSRA